MQKYHEIYFHDLYAKVSGSECFLNVLFGFFNSLLTFTMKKEPFLVNSYLKTALFLKIVEWDVEESRKTLFWSGMLRNPLHKLFLNYFGAGDGNRTHAASLGSWNSTIELHPQTIWII